MSRIILMSVLSVWQNRHARWPGRRTALTRWSPAAFRFLSTVTVCLVLTAVTTVQAADRHMRAGAAVSDITPKKYPVPMSGSMTPRWATQAHDPLSARCMVLDDGATHIAFCVIDACAITFEIMEAAKAQAQKLTGIPIERICMSATHTHTGVSVGIGFQTPAADDDYIQYMIKQIAAGIKQAADRLEPAQIGWAYADEPRHVGNRRWLLKPGCTPIHLVQKKIARG